MRLCTTRMLGCVLALSAVGCSSSKSTGESSVKIGFLYSTEGFFGAFEPPFVDAARLAAEIINEQGGALNRKLEIVPVNYAGKIDRIPKLVKELVEQQVVAVIGPLVSPYSEAIHTLPEQHETPFFTLTSDLAFDDAPYIFNLLATQADHASVAAERAIAVGQHSMAVIYEQALLRAEQELEREYEARGGEIVQRIELSSEDEADKALAQIMASPPDVILLLATPALGAGVLNRFLQSYSVNAVAWRLWPTLCVSDFGLGVPGIETLRHESISTSFQSGSSHQAFLQAYQRRFPTNIAIGHSTFDAVFALALALEAAGSDDGMLVREALPEVTRGGKQYDFLEYARARAAIRAGKDVDFAGTSHSFDYGQSDRLERGSVEFVLCHFRDNGKLEFGSEPFTLED